jgi:spore germination protein
MQIHVVQSRDTLWTISQQYQVTINQIVTANQLEDPNKLVPGLAIVIPTGNQTAVVKPGETISIIANRHRISVQSILQANGISDPTNILPGMTLVIPSVRHSVLPGESLYQIAQYYSTSVPAIVQANNLQNITMIYPGSVLQIPPYKPTIDVNAYSDRNGTAAASLFREVGPYLTFGALFAYSMEADGSLRPMDDAAFLQTAKAERITPMLCITNFTYKDPGSHLARTILSSTDIQNTLLSNVLNTMRQKGYYGLTIDFENVFPQDRELYNQFLQ